MALIPGKSKKSFEKNVKTEIESGKDPKQSLAIAYNVQRKNKRKRYAEGSKEPVSFKGNRPMTEKEKKEAADFSRGAMTNPYWEKTKQFFGYGEEPQKKYDGGQVLSADAKAPNGEKMLNMPPRDAHPEDHNFSDQERASISNSLTTEELAMIKRHRMAHGGEVEIDFVSEKRAHADEPISSVESNMLHKDRQDHKRGKNEIIADEAEEMQEEEYERERLARGGRVGIEDEEAEMRHASLAAAVMAKRKKMASGGEVGDDQVDLEANSREARNLEDDLSYEALEKEQYDLSQLSKQPRDSNEKGRSLPQDNEHSMIESIRRKIKSKRFKD